jgi:hypothetical protein
MEILYEEWIHVRPFGRGMVLEDLEFKPQLEDIPGHGLYEAEVRIIRRLSEDMPQ